MPEPPAKTGSAEPLIPKIAERESLPDTDPEWIKRAKGYASHKRSNAGAALDAGESYFIDAHAHDTAYEVIQEFENKLPPGVKIGVLRYVKPIPGTKDWVRGLYSNFPDFANNTRRESIRSGVAYWDPNARVIAISATVRRA